jgi:hypothetical protein
MIIDIQTVLNIYIDYLDDLSLYKLKNDIQLNLNASHKKILLHQESIFIFQSLRLLSLILNIILSNRAVNIAIHN